MPPEYTSVLVEPRVHAVPVAQAALTANLLSCNSSQLQQAIDELVLNNPLVEPVSAEYEAVFPDMEAGESLSDHLASQLRINVRSPRLLQVCLFLVHSLDRNGYLKESEKDICLLCRCSRDMFQEALHQVQKLDPVGIGARSLSECLCLQLEAMEPVNQLALTICRHYLPQLAEKCLPPLGADEAELNQAVALILSLSPRPGSTFDSDPVPYILPDILVRRCNGSLEVSLANQPQLPILSPMCSALVRSGTEQERLYIREHLARARSFFFAIQQRSSSLLAVATFAVQHQKEFFLSSLEHPVKPLTMTSVARALPLSVSTVSRAVKEKYVDYDGKIFPMRTLFPSGGIGSASRQQVVQKITEICQVYGQSISDQAVSSLLADQGISVARRTVNKYRKSIL